MHRKLRLGCAIFGGLLTGGLGLAALAAPSLAAERPYSVTEERQACADHDPLRRGDREKRQHSARLTLDDERQAHDRRRRFAESGEELACHGDLLSEGRQE